MSLAVASFEPSFNEHGNIPPVAINGVVAFLKRLISGGLSADNHVIFELAIELWFYKYVLDRLEYP